MSALAPKYQQYLSMADEVQTTDKSHARPSNENFNDIVRYLQTHASSQGNPQTTGARDMIKAGQRRLKLALRTNKKVTGSKAKSDDAARQWVSLQQEGAFPRSRYRKPEQKPEQNKNAPSITSNSKSVSDLSFKSNSKRDIETMGRPWLDNPLENRDEPGSKGSSSQLSSLDLRDLASFVEAAVNFSSEFDDSNPPPYQPLTEQLSKPTEGATPLLDLNLRSDAPSTSNSSTTARSSEDVSSNSSYELPRTQSNSLTQSRTPSGQQNVSLKRHMSSIRLAKVANLRQSGNQHLADLRSSGDMSIPSRPPRTSSSTSSKGSSAPPTPVLKLFPDTMPPQMSSKGALRVPTGRSPTPSQSFPQPPVPQKTNTLAAVTEPGNRDSINSSNSLSKIAGYAAGSREGKPREPERRPENNVESEEPRDRQTKHSRRPSSIPPGAIDASPIPAPIRPLPTVPEPSSRAQVRGIQRPSVDSSTVQTDSKRRESELQARAPPHISVSTPSSPGSNQTSSRGRASPFPRLMAEETDSSTMEVAAEAAGLLQPRRSSLGKAGRSREEKVRSLIFRDLAASRCKRGPGKSQMAASPPTEAQELQVSSSHRIEATSALRAHRQYQRKVSPGPSSPPPNSPPPSDPPRHTLQGRRYGITATSTMAATIESFENLSRPSQDRNARVNRKTSVRGAEPKHGRRSMEQNNYDGRAETPLPSSDDEGPTGGFYWNPPQKAAKRRRPRPAPILIDEPSPPRGRTLKKRHDSGGLSPPTPQGLKTRAPERSHHAHPTPVDHQSHNAHGYYAAEPKPNPSLEGRIEHLERQNKILQAALLAALDVGVKQDLSSLLGASAASMSTNATPPLTGRSFSTTTNTSTSEAQSTGQERRGRNGKPTYRPESWVTSSDSLRKDIYESEDSADSPQIPQHVSALLSHLTSRPGVQSTLILSRKDGSIIQSTGLLAPPKRTRSETSPLTAVPSTATTEDPLNTTTAPPTTSSPAAETTQQSPTQTQTQSQQRPPHQPSQAEALAAHIFAFVSSASNLSLTLSNPVGEGGRKGSESGFVNVNGAENGGGFASTGSGTGREDAEGDGGEGQDDDEVKLLRLRTKKHEIVVVPDKKYLLCVVHDASAGATSAALAAGGGGRLGR
ncbi:hypothetical protein BJX66DRAFT_350280 [Aspergillus keveii]|uniref:Roadblock/LAMTOR2 domain-containing protein n=1 Tax=Aspergillus keveii TaxID=714993 RepID=A0ABR4GAD6_9EURO